MRQRSKRPPPSARYSRERVDELEAAIAELTQRQNAKPHGDVHGRMMLALLISAFERTLERTRAGLDDAA